MLADGFARKNLRRHNGIYIIYIEWSYNNIYGMNVPTLKLVLRPILSVTSVWNTGETGDIYCV